MTGVEYKERAMSSKSNKGAKRKQRDNGQMTENRDIMFRCFKCREGFTRQEWGRAKYCSNCGRFLRRSSKKVVDIKQKAAKGSKKVSQAQQPPSRAARRKARAGQKAPRTRHRNDTYTPEVVRQKRGRGMANVVGGKVNVQTVAVTIKNRPFLSAAVSGVAGAGLLVAGPAIMSLGAAISTGGLVVAGLNAATIPVTAGNRDSKALVPVQCKGVALGVGAAMAGGALMVIGKTMTVAGVLSVGSSGVIAGYGVCKEVQAARKQR